MRRSLLKVAALCAAPLAAACDLGTTPTTPIDQISLSGFVGKGIFSDSVTTGAPAGYPFRLVAADSSGQDGGELLIASETVPPAGTYDLDTYHFPQGYNRFGIEFVLTPAGGSAELYEPLGGSMVLGSLAGDSIAGTLTLSMYVAALCVGAQLPLTCQPLSMSTKQLTLSGTFVAQRTPAAGFPGS